MPTTVSAGTLLLNKTSGVNAIPGDTEIDLGGTLLLGNTNQIIDSQGMCLDGRYRRANDGLPLPVAKCQSGPAWRFVYLGTGLIQDVKNGKCLFVAGAAANAPVWLKDCDTSFAGQRWLVTH